MQQDTRRTPRRDKIVTVPTDPDAFLLWSAEQPREEGKFELSRGKVVCTMIHASRGHSRVCRNLIVELSRLLDPDAFDVSAADFAVRTAVGIRSPDVVVDRAKPEGRELETRAPIFIAEVLSPSTAGIDFTDKLQEYTTIDTVQTYLICSQDEPRAWVWSRGADRSWPELPVEHAGREGAFALAGLDAELTMAAIFRGIPDAPSLG
jgi:Uma2 family endonuclease